ncbi:MAG: hypothetical protein AAFP02_12705 [Bacteroidota bacterium]
MKKYITKILIYSAGVFLLNLLIGWGLKSMGPKYSESEYGYIKWDALEKMDEEQLDILFIGSSHFLSGINPAVIDSLTGANSFNIAGVGLRPGSAYIALKEVLNQHQPKVVVLDIFHRTFIGSSYNHLYNFGYVDLEGEKFDFYRKELAFDEKVRVALPTYTYRNHFPGARILFGIKKKMKNWKESTYKGYVPHENTIKAEELAQNEFKNYVFKPEAVGKKNLEYLDKVVKLCKEKGIQLVWTTTPLPMVCLEDIKNKEAIDQYFQQLADQYQVPYINYNDLELRQQLALVDLEDYNDDDHLNVRGADKMCTDLSSRLKSYIDQNPALTYQPGNE